MHPIRKSKSTADEKKRQICSPGMFFLIYDRATRRAKEKINMQRSGRGAADFSISSIFLALERYLQIKAARIWDVGLNCERRYWVSSQCCFDVRKEFPDQSPLGS